MNSSFRFVLLLILPIFLGGCERLEPSSSWQVVDRSGEPIIGEYLIQIHPSFAAESSVETLGRRIIAQTRPEDCRLLQTFQVGTFIGFHIQAKPTVITYLRQDPRITWIEPNRKLHLSFHPQRKALGLVPQQIKGKEIVPQGIIRAGGPVNMANSDRAVWILDSGIDSAHPDLNINPSLSRNFLGPAGDYSDQWGHGTHIAGIIGAKQNEMGVTGLAAGVSLVSLRILDQQGKGSVATLLKALEYTAVHIRPKDVLHVSPKGTDSKMVGIALQNLHENQQVQINLPDFQTSSSPSYHHVLSTYTNGQYFLLTGTAIEAAHHTGRLLWSTPSTASNTTYLSPNLSSNRESGEE